MSRIYPVADEAYLSSRPSESYKVQVNELDRSIDSPVSIRKINALSVSNGSPGNNNNGSSMNSLASSMPSLLPRTSSNLRDANGMKTYRNSATRVSIGSLSENNPNASTDENEESKSDEAFEQILSSKGCVQLLINYLNENPHTSETPSLLRKFNSLTREFLVRFSVNTESRLFATLKDHGWNGAKYGEDTLDTSLLYISLLSLYSNYNQEISKYNISNKGNLIKSFCPTLLLENLVDISKSKSPLSATKLEFEGVCMLADISGFTKLAAKYSAEGSAGLDKLHETTTFFLGQFVEQVYSYEGDVIAFAGDALVCVFDMKDSHVNSRICCLDALRCALELKDLRRDPLTVHIALSYGSMSLGRLGGYNDEWIYLLNGGCLAELHHCIEDASSQQIVMTEEMYDVINEELRDQEILEVEDTSSGNKRLIRLEVTDTYKSTFNRFAPFSDTGQLISLSERFVPKPVRDSLNVFKEIGELRKVTTMFINLDSYCPTANEDPVTLQPFFFMAQKALADTGGFMRQFLVDDKGCVLIGMWGVPSFSHANNSILALRCAVSIQEKSGLLKHVCSVGITTGNVYCGTVGSVLRHDYVGIGGSVNMAARLMCAAKEAVMMDEATYLLLNQESKSSMVVGRSLTLKGIPHPVVSFVFKGGEAAVSQSATEDVGSFSVVRKDVSRTLVALLRNLIASFSDEDSSCGANLVLPSSPSSGQQQHSSPLSRYGFLSPSRLGANGSNGPSHSLAAASVINSSESTDAFASKICPTINFCIIEGEAGMGRSNAANYFRTSAQLLQINCISIIARHGDETINYGVLKRLFFELVPPYIRTSAGQKEILSPLFERVLGIDYNQDEFCLQLDCLRTFLDIENPLSLKTGLLNTSDSLAIVSKGLYFEEDIIPYFDKMILELLAESRCAVVIEDAQYCDKLTWIKFASYMDVVNLNTLFLLTIHLDSNKTKKKFAHSSKLQQPGMSSPTQVGATFDVFTDVALQQQLFDSDTYIKISTNEAKCIKLVLSALTMSDIENVLMSTFKSKKVSLSLVKTVFEVSSGNPFWITSIADFICDRGSEGFAKALEAKDSQNPLNALILCRLDLLNPEHFYVAKVASIIGDEFTRDLLVHLLPDVRNISACLVALKSNGFIQSVETDSANNFEFQNPLLRTTIYDLIPPQVTFDNHLKIAKYIETTFASNLSPHYNRLSYHFAKIAGRRSDAFKYTSKSADLAIRHAAFSEGLIYLQTAKTMLLTKIEYKSLLKIIDLAITDLSRGRNMSFGKLISSLRSDPQLDGYRALKEELESKLKLMETPKAAPARLAPVREGLNEVAARERSGTTERSLTSSNSGALPSSLQLLVPVIDTPLKSELNLSQASQRRSIFSPEPKPSSIPPHSVKQSDGEENTPVAAGSGPPKHMTSNETSRRPGLEKSTRPSLHFQLSYADTRFRQRKKWIPSSCVLS